MNASASSTSFARFQCGFVRMPSARSRSSRSCCDVTSRPAAEYDHIARLRFDVAPGSSCRTAPAAALRGFAKSASPRSARSLFVASNAAVGQVDLTAHVDATRHLLAERERDRLDRPEVRGHVLAHGPVAARRALHEPTVLIGEVDGQPVDLQLAHVSDVLAAEALPHALVECAELGFIEGVRERQHRMRVLDRCETVRRRRPDPLCRRLGRDELGMLRLELLELAHQRVVRLVGDRRRIEDVVLVVRLLDPLAQLGGALLDGRTGHASILAQATVLASRRWPQPHR